MRRAGYIIFCFILVLTAYSCRRRPLVTADNNVQVVISINTDIVNHTVDKLPSMMRVMFFDNETGRFATQAFLPLTGGIVNLVPNRVYDMLVYNFNTESTIIGNENIYDAIYATTNNVPDSYRNTLRSRGTKFDDEKIVYEPDHLFVGSLEDVYIPARGTGMERVVLEVEASTVVETWKLIIDKIDGIEWVSGIYGVISGLSEGNILADRIRIDNHVSVFLENYVTYQDGSVEFKFNTFGYNPAGEQISSLVIVDVAGKGHEFNIDISDRFIDNKRQIIEIKTDKIVIEKPEDGTGEGGLKPDVDDWENIETDIVI